LENKSLARFGDLYRDSQQPSDSSYTNQEIHKWEMIPPTAWANSLYTWYWAKWTVTGGGSNADFIWTTNGSGWVILQFWVPTPASPGIGSGLLNIAEAESAPDDPFGMTVKSKKDGTPSTASVSEWEFPDIFANPGMINSVQGYPNPPLPPINGALFIKEPSDGINTVTCSWDFEYQPILLKQMPGTLCRPDMPDCDKPIVVKPPIKRPD
jgi:hypothetical protein